MWYELLEVRDNIWILLRVIRWMQINRCVFHDIKTILIQDWEQQLEAHDHISVLMRTVVKNYVEFPIAVIDVLQKSQVTSISDLNEHILVW